MNEFQNLSKRTLNTTLDKRDQALNYLLGLSGESGEVVDLMKKALFHGHELNKNKLAEELGDVMFYVAAIATTFDIELESIANGNIKKLKRRYPDGFSEKASQERTI